MRQNNMLAATKSTGNSNRDLIRNIKDLIHSDNPETQFESIAAQLENQGNDLTLDDLEQTEATDLSSSPSDSEPEEEDATDQLPALKTLQSLKVIDQLVASGITPDEETIEFLICNRVDKLWQDCFNKVPGFDLEQLRQETGGIYFKTIRDRFLTQHEGASNLAIPEGYSFKYKPNLMQCLTAYRVLTERRLGNWSGVGAGKTVSAILSSRVIQSKVTLIVAINSTVEAWHKVIMDVFPDSHVSIKERGDLGLKSDRYNYIILNFETFQQSYAAEFARDLVEQCRIDFVVIDEIQSVKQRTSESESYRREVLNGLLCVASEKNPDLCVLGMSATPVINNLFEAKALLEMIKGTAFPDLKTFSSIANAITMHEKLILHGIRYRPNYKQSVDTQLLELPGEAYLTEIAQVFNQKRLLEKERVLLDIKFPSILDNLRPGTLVYTHYLDGLIEPLKARIQQAGFTVGEFTGRQSDTERQEHLKQFISRKIDILIGTAPINTGVDGLQYVCNRMVIACLPWTGAEYEQLIGRIYRQGSQFDKVEVIIPQVVLNHDQGLWSWDKWRWERICWKKTLADAAIDGVIPEGELTSLTTLQQKASEALQAWIDRVEQEGIYTLEREKLQVPLPESETRIAQRRFGDFSQLNARFNTAYSQTTHDRLQQNPEEWYLYHTLYREARKSWSEIPFEVIAEAIQARPDWVVGDFGCGEALLAERLPNKVYSFDHVAISDRVLACDMARIPLKDGVLDVAIFSLSLMGLNYFDYLQEAKRLLKPYGLLKIAEPTSRWEGKREKLLEQLKEIGFQMLGTIRESYQFFYLDALRV
ncbi:MAG: helicase-related protein [Prochlorotrichaceae cyanobacterium]